MGPEMKLLDTCFLINLQREIKKDAEGRATKYLRIHRGESFAVSVISITEFLEGFEDAGEGEKFLRPFYWLDIDGPRARIASRIRRDLRLAGQLIGDFDILIAATALADQITLVTDNTDHFQRIRGLEMESY